MARNEPWEVPYDNANHAFFCMVDRQRVVAEGGRFSQGKFQRPGSGIDVQKVIERLYREKRLHSNHIKILQIFGRRGERPSYDVPAEKQAAELWDDAMQIIEPSLIKKGLVDSSRAL